MLISTMRPITTLTDYEKNRVAGDIFTQEPGAGWGEPSLQTF